MIPKMPLTLLNFGLLFASTFASTINTSAEYNAVAISGLKAWSDGVAYVTAHSDNSSSTFTSYQTSVCNGIKTLVAQTFPSVFCSVTAISNDTDGSITGTALDSYAEVVILTSFISTGASDSAEAALAEIAWNTYFPSNNSTDEYDPSNQVFSIDSTAEEPWSYGTCTSVNFLGSAVSLCAGVASAGAFKMGLNLGVMMVMLSYFLM